MNVGIDNFLEEGEEIPEDIKREKPADKPDPKWLTGDRWAVIYS